jgi:hypothetical protein
MILANLYGYVPTRTFASDGDVVHFIRATGVSPWATHVIVGYLVLRTIIDSYQRVLPYTLNAVGFIKPGSRAAVLVADTAHPLWLRRHPRLPRIRSRLALHCPHIAAGDPGNRHHALAPDRRPC